jgi:creatinine amidohydrolase/Fe(II)-dependent formamide hydrolase-like protein
MAGEHEKWLGSAVPCLLSRLTFGEAEQEIRRTGALIVPLGGCEPYSSCGSLGAASACAEALASALSATAGIPVAPVLHYGCSTPYGAFGGTAGVKPRTLTNIVCESLRLWYLQGFRKFVLIDALYENSEALDLAAARMKNSNPDSAVMLFSLQRDERIRAFIAGRMAAKEHGRTEYGILSLAAFIDPALVRVAAPAASRVGGADPDRFRVWRKRGADPQQFRKHFPDCSGPAYNGRYDADFGRELFDYILKLMEETVAPAVRPRTQHP